jgi:predicted transcriptional regulator YheO
MNSIRNEEKTLRSIVKGIAAHFGPQCEVVLHDLKDQPYDSTIIAIENGQVTGRKVGDCGTNLGLEVLRGTENGGDRYNYMTQSKGGRILRSTTLHIRDENDDVIGALCMNFDITDLIMAEQALASVTQHSLFGPSVEECHEKVNEVFATDVTELLDALIQESLQQVGKPVAHMSKEDKTKGIEYLDRKGAFLIKKSVDRVAKFYEVSRYTIYSYLDSARDCRENARGAVQ